MSANQQALLMASNNAVTVDEACVADPYYSCGPTNDPYWANVVLLLHMDGTDGSTTFTDSSSYARAMTAAGNAQIDTAEFKFGTASGLFDGTGDNVQTPNGADFQFLGDFTVEAWVRPTTTGSFTNIFIQDNGTVNAWWLRKNNLNELGYGVVGGSDLLTGGTINSNVWTHVAICRSGTTLRLFVNGLQVNAGTGYSATIGIDTGTAEIGGGSFAYTGNIDDLRITKGVARYTGNFNIPTAAFPDALETVWDPTDPRTVLSLHADDVTVEDSSCYQPKTVTLAGTLGNLAVVTDLAYKFGGKSFFVPNSGSASTAGVVISDHQDLDFGTGDFTIEMWAYHSSNDYAGTLFYFTEVAAFSLVVAATTGLVTLNYHSSGGTQANVATGVTFPLTTWQHVVVQRRGTNFEFYLDGVLGNTTAITGGASSTVNSAGDFYLGRTNASSALSWNGYIDEARITKGVARYDPDFLVPSTAFPDSAPDDDEFSNVTFLTHADGSNGSTTITEVSASKTVSVFGNTSLSTTSPKFGSASIAFDGIGDYATAPTSADYDFGSGDFTVEAWVYPSALGSLSCIIGNRPSSPDRGWAIYVGSAGAFAITAWNSSAASIVNIAGGLISAGAWTHVAATRRNGFFYLCINGVPVSVAYTTALIGDSADTLTIGKDKAVIGRDFLGKIDDIRITKGVARYPAPFDPATLPNCDSVVPGSVTAVDGTSPLTGASVTVSQQTIGNSEAYGTVSSTVATIGQGSVSPSVVLTNPTVALTGRSVTVSRGSLTAPAYPDLNDYYTGRYIIVAPGAGGLTVFFEPDGTFRTLDTNGIVRTPTTASWIDKTQTNYDIVDISHQYRVVSVVVLEGPSSAFTYPTIPVSLESSFSVQIYNFTQAFISFIFQVTIAPTETNPRYGETGYYGTYYVQALIRTG